MTKIPKIILSIFLLLLVASFVLLNNTQLSEQVFQTNEENSSSEMQTGSIGDSESISSSFSSSQNIPSSSSSENTSTDETQTPPSSEEQSSDAPPSSQEQSSEAPHSSAGQGSESSSKPEPVLPPPVQQRPLPSIGKYMVGYYTSWSASKGYYPSSIDAKKLTHINYAFAGISQDNKILLNNPTVDLKNLEGLRNLRNQNPDLKILISVGGWDDSKYFSNVALTAQSRETFADSCVSFLIKHDLDGIDLDWEYPVSGGMAGNINRPEDKQNFTKLLQTIRNKLDEQSQKDAKTYYLTIAGGISSSYVKNIELTNILKYIDYIFIMGYDIHGTWENYSDLNAPLYSPQEPSPQHKTSVSDGVNNYLKAGAPASKLVLGMPFYGYKYNLSTDDNDGLYQTFSSAKSISYDLISSDYLSDSAYIRFTHPQAKVPYIFGNNTFISYDDSASIALKTQYAKSLGLAGVGAWELSHDSSGVLLDSAYNSLH